MLLFVPERMGAEMGERRLYGQFCGLAGALDLVGERWTLLVIRELLPGPARFGDVLANLPGIGPNLLSLRLRTLAEAGIVEQRRTEQDGRGREYQLTERGEALREPVLALARWGLGQLSPADGDRGETRASWSLLAVEAMVRGRAATGVAEDYEFRVGGVVFHVSARGDRATVVRGAASAPAIVVTTDPGTFVEIGARIVSPFVAAVSGRLSVEGDPAAVDRCLGLMGLTSSGTLGRIGGEGGAGGPARSGGRLEEPAQPGGDDGDGVVGPVDESGPLEVREELSHP